MAFELTTPVFERAKTVHALDGVAAVIGNLPITKFNLFHFHNKRDVTVFGVVTMLLILWLQQVSYLSEVYQKTAFIPNMSYDFNI
jgi:hypothetical protein